MSNIASPFSTGGGGSNYEAQVGAYYLTTLLAQAVPRGQKAGKTIEVRFQRLFEGEPLDDLVIISELPAGKAKLALQIKRDLSFGSKSTTFNEVLYAYWKTLKSSQFNIGIDRFGIAVGLYSKKIDEHYQSVLEWADTSASSADFFNRANQQNLSNQEQRSFIGLIRSKLDSYLGSSIADAELWDFLRSMVILHFDFQKNSSRDWTHAVQRINHLLSPDHKAASPQIFSELVQIAERAKRTAGSFNVDTLRKELQNRGIKLQTPQQSQTQLPDRLSTDISNKQVQETDWQQICRGMLPIELDTNPLIAGDGVKLGVEDIVPLDLVERKERPQSPCDLSPENSRQALEEQEIPLPYDQFFDHVLSGCRSLNQQGKGMAIIGEPGAGKTTLLYAIADWIIKRGDLPIFVSLQNLETDPLKIFLLEDWLTDALRKREAPKQLQDDLVEQCNAGRVWLLLDGVDEMAQSDRFFSVFAREFKGWIADARVVLTCRVNVWEANRNDLRSRFEVYRSRGFNDDDQFIFIQNFFAKVNQPKTGSKLIQELENAPLRLKDLIKTPLWLTLLCRTWKRRRGSVPETKAELYRQFTGTFYDWKDKPHVPKEKRPLLERALGELAKKAIDQEQFRFHLRETFIRQELDKFDSSLFDITCDLGWINKLGSVEDPYESVYAFLHPTFQEYFAALAIEDWDDFLPRNHIDKPIENRKGECKYRILEPQWKEVILFWLGRSDVEKDEKETFIDRLTHFDDECGEIYKYRAYFLAAAGIAEFEYSRANKIIAELIKQGFRHFDQEKKGWVREIRRPLEQGARYALSKTDRKQASLILVQFIQEKPSDLFSRRDALDVLGQIGFKHPVIIEFLEQLIFDETQHESIYLQAIQSLGHIDPDNANIVRRPEHIVAKEKEEAEEMLRSFAQGYTGKPIIVFGRERSITEIPHSHLFHWLDLEGLRNSAVETQLKVQISDLKRGLLDASYRNNGKVFAACYKALWQCAENMDYPDFFEAWHSLSLLVPNCL